MNSNNLIIDPKTTIPDALLMISFGCDCVKTTTIKNRFRNAFKINEANSFIDGHKSSPDEDAESQDSVHGEERFFI